MKSRFKSSLEEIVDLGRNIGDSILKHKKNLMTTAAALALPFIFANTAKAVTGSVSVSYYIEGIGSAGWNMAHMEGASDGLDDYDQVWNMPPHPSGISVKATSSAEGKELVGEALPDSDPPSGSSCSLSIESDGDVIIPEGTTHYVNASASGYEGYKVYANGENITDGGTINLGMISAGTYSGGLSTGSISISFESTTPIPNIHSPSVSTNSATSIGKTSATLEGILTNDGYAQGDEPCDYRFSYWISGGSTQTTGWSGSIYEGDTFSASISGLTPDTSYSFVAEARNSAGESSGGTSSFNTLSPGSVDPDEPDEQGLENLLKIKHQEGTSFRIWRLALKDGALNGLDENDQLSTSETGPKIYSIVSEDPTMYELKLDVRENTNESILLEASSISQSGQPKTFSIDNELQLSLEDPNANITIQPYNPDNPSKHPAYDIGALTNNGTGAGIIKILDSNDPEKTLAFYMLNFNSKIAHWTLDESEGNTAYDKINGYNGIVSGNPNWQSDGGKVSGALQLDGIDDYIKTPFILNPSNGPFSVYTWVKGSLPGQVIISQQGGQTWLNTESLEGKLATGLKDDSATDLHSPETITDNEWHRVGFVWTGSKRSLYVDGKEVAKDTESLNNLPDSQGELYFGAGSDSHAGKFWNGSIDDIIIYNLPVGDMPQKESTEPEGENFEGFETGNFSKFNWDTSAYNTSPGAQWIITSETPYGNYCAKAVNNKKGGNTYLTATVDCKDGEISFYRKLSSSGGSLFFTLDDRTKKYISEWKGEKDWENFSYPVTAGEHTFIWFYKQDQEVTDGEAAWIDNITFPLAD